MNFDNFKEATRVIKSILRLIHRGVKWLIFKLLEPFIGSTIKKKFEALVSEPLIPVEQLNANIDPAYDANYFSAFMNFRPHCGKCEAEVLGREIILASSREGQWHAVPWPVLAKLHHNDKDNLWSWLTHSYDWGKTKKNVERLATISRVRDDEGPEFMIPDGQNLSIPNYQFNGLHDYMPIGIDTLIDLKLVEVLRDNSGVDLIIPTTELVRRAKSSAEFNLTLR